MLVEIDPKCVDVARKLTAMAEDDTRAWDRLAYVADVFGHRLSGSKALEQTIDWAVETMRADGLANARREKVMVPHWVRGEEWAKIHGKVERKLPVLTLGMSVGTGRKPIRAQVVVVEHGQEQRHRLAQGGAAAGDAGGAGWRVEESGARAAGPGAADGG